MKNKRSIQGRRISRKEALKGLGNPKKWEKEKEELMKGFRERPRK